MMPNHHPSDELLIAYAAGSQSEPLDLVVATHLALCPRCRNEVALLEELGGSLLKELPGESLDQADHDSILALLDEARPEEPVRPAPRSLDVDPMIPSPLRDYLAGPLEQLDWNSFQGVSQVDLLPGVTDVRTRLMRIKPGTAMPSHTHGGSELTLVLAGGFSDEKGHYLRGDFAEADASVVHQPVADPGEECICLAVTDGPLRLTGPFARLLNPFLRF
ncbi:MAG: ChrR family anti-sigma-E factor [Pseudomonadota bacterium]